MKSLRRSRLELDGLTGAIHGQTRGKHLSAGRLAAHETEIDKLHAELERISVIDFFSAGGRQPALAAYERCQKAIRAAHGPASKATRSITKSGSLDLPNYQGRRWMTPGNLHIDRLASAWLIRQFIDKRARFYFVAEGEAVEGAIAFDMFGAEFTHHGEDCTFETILKRFGLNDNESLREMAEIVHDIDLKDDKFHRLEAAGLNAIINGLGEMLRDDRKLLQQCSVIFDGLYGLLAKSAQKDKSKQNVRRRSSRKRGRSPHR